MERKLLYDPAVFWPVTGKNISRNDFPSSLVLQLFAALIPDRLLRTVQPDFIL